MKKGPQRRKSLLVQASISDFVLIFGAAIALTTLGLWTRSIEWRQQLDLRAHTAVQFLASQSEYGLLLGDRDELQRIANSALASDDVLYVAIADDSGRILATAGQAASGPNSSGLLGCNGVLEQLTGLRPRVEVTQWESASQSLLF